VASDALHCGCPPDAHVPRHLGDGVAVFSDAPADLLGRPPGEGALDRRRLLGEALGRAVRIETEPPALAPHQAHRPSAHRQVPDLDLASSVPGRSDPAARAARHVSSRLDEHPELAVHFGLGEHDEALHPEQCARVATTVIHALCPPFSLVAKRKNRRRRAPTGGCLWARHRLAPPHTGSRRAHLDEPWGIQHRRSVAISYYDVAIRDGHHQVLATVLQG